MLKIKTTLDYKYFSHKKKCLRVSIQLATSTGPIGTSGNLIGKSKGWEIRLKELENTYKLQIENGNTYIQNLFTDLTPTQEDDLKTFLLEQLNLNISDYEYQFTQLDLDLKATTLKYVKNINALNIINGGGDGYGENGKWTVLKLSGGSETYPVVNGVVYQQIHWKNWVTTTII